MQAMWLVSYEAMTALSADQIPTEVHDHFIETPMFITVHLTDLKDETELCRLCLEGLDQRVLCYTALPSTLCNPIFS